jgi:hypothetical protein
MRLTNQAIHGASNMPQYFLELDESFHEQSAAIE